jgi:hypothetical protein
VASCLVGKRPLGARQLRVRGSNPPSDRSTSRGPRRESPVAWDCGIPAVTARVHRGAAASDAVRTQRHPSPTMYPGPPPCYPAFSQIAVIRNRHSYGVVADSLLGGGVAPGTNPGLVVNDEHSDWPLARVVGIGPAHYPCFPNHGSVEVDCRGSRSSVALRLRRSTDDLASPACDHAVPPHVRWR